MRPEEIKVGKTYQAPSGFRPKEMIKREVLDEGKHYYVVEGESSREPIAVKKEGFAKWAKEELK